MSQPFIVRRFVLAAPVLAALVVAGCGSDNSSSSSSTATTPAITKAQFVAKANAICAKGNQVTDKAGASLSSHPTPAQVAAVVKATFAPSVQAQIDQVRALGAPAGDEATVKKFLDDAQADLNRLKSDPSLLTQNQDTFADFGKLAHPYGLKECDKQT